MVFVPFSCFIWCLHGSCVMEYISISANKLNPFFGFSLILGPIFEFLWFRRFSGIFPTLFSHLFCTLISENQGLEKLRSVSNLRKISGPAQLIFFSVHLSFFSVCHLDFFQVYGINLKNTQVTNWKKTQVCWKKNQVCRTWIYSKVWNRP